MKSAAVVKGATHPHWCTQERSDTRYRGVRQTFYFCPLKLVKFIELEG